jgi:hypothetical protein
MRTNNHLIKRERNPDNWIESVSVRQLGRLLRRGEKYLDKIISYSIMSFWIEPC